MLRLRKSGDMPPKYAKTELFFSLYRYILHPGKNPKPTQCEAGWPPEEVWIVFRRN